MNRSTLAALRVVMHRHVRAVRGVFTVPSAIDGIERFSRDDTFLATEFVRP